MMKKRKVFMFPGQGSQYYSMGKELYEKEEIFRRWMDKLDGIIMDMKGYSVVAEMYYGGHGISKTFNELKYTHPGVFIMQYSLAQLFIENGIRPDMVIGSSLGEMAAAAVAGAIHYEQALALTLKQVETVSTYCRNGAMLAVVAGHDLYYQCEELNLYSTIASYNYENHFVISGEVHHIRQIAEYLKGQNVIHSMLPVTYAFHSQLMEPIREAYTDYLSKVHIRTPSIPYYSTSFEEQVSYFSQDYFWNVIRCPMDFTKMIRSMDVSSNVFIDIGPSATMTNFVKYNLKDSQTKCYYFITPMTVDTKQVKTFFMEQQECIIGCPI